MSWFLGKPKINKEELQTRIAVLEQRVDKLEGVPQTAAPLALRAPVTAVAAPPQAAPAQAAPAQAALRTAAPAPAAVPQEQFSRVNSSLIDQVNLGIQALLGEKYSANVERNIKLSPSQRTYPCGYFTLECLVASGQNLNCFLNSFFTVTCPAFRAALVKQASYFSTTKMTTDQFSERYRSHYLLTIITSVAADPKYMGRDATKESIRAGDVIEAERERKPVRVRTEEELKEIVKKADTSIIRSVEVIKGDIKPSNTRKDLSDDLIAFLCHYYTIRIVLFGQPDQKNGRSFARLIGRTGPVYAISNPGVGHFEPCRVKGDNRYILTPDELESITDFYGGIADEADQKYKEFEQQFAGINVPREEWKNTNVIGHITEHYRSHIRDANNNNTIVRLQNLQNEIKEYKRNTGGQGRSVELDTLATEIRTLQASAVNDPDPETDTSITEELEKKVRAIIGVSSSVVQVAAPATVRQQPVTAQRSSAWTSVAKGLPRARAPALLPPPLPKGSPRASVPPEPQWEDYGDDQKYIAALTAFYKQYPQAAAQVAQKKQGGRRRTRRRRVSRKGARYTRK
jgi:hypothetical protein